MPDDRCIRSQNLRGVDPAAEHGMEIVGRLVNREAHLPAISITTDSPSLLDNVLAVLVFGGG